MMEFFRSTERDDVSRADTSLTQTPLPERLPEYRSAAVPINPEDHPQLLGIIRSLLLDRHTTDQEEMRKQQLQMRCAEVIMALAAEINAGGKSVEQGWERLALLSSFGVNVPLSLAYSLESIGREDLRRTVIDLWYRLENPAAAMEYDFSQNSAVCKSWQDLLMRISLPAAAEVVGAMGGGAYRAPNNIAKNLLTALPFDLIAESFVHRVESARSDYVHLGEGLPGQVNGAMDILFAVIEESDRRPSLNLLQRIYTSAPSRHVEAAADSLRQYYPERAPSIFLEAAMQFDDNDRDGEVRRSFAVRHYHDCGEANLISVGKLVNGLCKVVGSARYRDIVTTCNAVSALLGDLSGPYGRKRVVEFAAAELQDGMEPLLFAVVLNLSRKDRYELAFMHLLSEIPPAGQPVLRGMRSLLGQDVPYLTRDRTLANPEVSDYCQCSVALLVRWKLHLRALAALSDEDKAIQANARDILEFLIEESSPKLLQNVLIPAIRRYMRQGGKAVIGRLMKLSGVNLHRACTYAPKE